MPCTAHGLIYSRQSYDVVSVISIIYKWEKWNSKRFQNAPKVRKQAEANIEYEPSFFYHFNALNHWVVICNLSSSHHLFIHVLHSLWSTFPACSHPTPQKLTLPSRNPKCLEHSELCPATAYTVLTHSSALSGFSIRRVDSLSSRITSCHLLFEVFST